MATDTGLYRERLARTVSWPLWPARQGQGALPHTYGGGNLTTLVSTPADRSRSRARSHTRLSLRRPFRLPKAEAAARTSVRARPVGCPHEAGAASCRSSSARGRPGTGTLSPVGPPSEAAGSALFRPVRASRILPPEGSRSARRRNGASASALNSDAPRRSRAGQLGWAAASPANAQRDGADRWTVARRSTPPIADHYAVRSK